MARVADLYAGMPTITGKLELEYEGELQGGDTVARELIRRAAARASPASVAIAPMSKRSSSWFDQGGALKVGTDERTETCWRAFGMIPGLLALVRDSGLADPRRPSHRRRGVRAGARSARRRDSASPAARSMAGSGARPPRRPKPGYGEDERSTL